MGTKTGIQNTAWVVNRTSRGGVVLNERITELRRKSWDSQTDRLDTEKLAKLILEDVISICEGLGDKGMDGHYCVDAIRNKFGVKG